MISHMETMPDGTPHQKLVWKIGEFDKTVGRGNTWGEALWAAVVKRQTPKFTRRWNPSEAETAEDARLEQLAHELWYSGVVELHHD